MSEICGLIIAAVFGFLNWKVSLGIILGLIFFRIYFYLLTSSIDDTLAFGIAEGKIGRIISSSGRIIILVMPLLVGMLLPQYVNVWGSFIGLILFKVCAVIYSAVRKN